MSIEAALDSPLVTTQIVRLDFIGPVDDVIQVDTGSHWLDLCLTPRLRESRACYPEHWHPERFEPLGDVFMIPAGQAFHARGEGGSLTTLVTLLHAELVQRLLEGKGEWTEGRLQSSLNIRSPSIRHLLLRLAEEARHPGFASEALCEAIADQLAIELARYYLAPLGSIAAGGLASWRLRLIDERVVQLQPAPTLSELANLCQISVRQLQRSFRTSRGCSIGEYVATRRIEKAKRLLERDESVKAIAYAMGFGSPASFVYAFRRATGETPGSYRRRSRAGK
jgi:AraC family transcriptional regulator